MRALSRAPSLWYKAALFAEFGVTDHGTSLSSDRQEAAQGEPCFPRQQQDQRRFLPNLQYRRFWVESENRWVRLRVSQAGLRTIDKKGIDVVLAELRAQGVKV